MATITENVQARIAEIDRQIARTRVDADATVADLQQRKQTLLAIAGVLAKVPEAEDLIRKAKGLGLLD